MSVGTTYVLVTRSSCTFAVNDTNDGFIVMTEVLENSFYRIILQKEFSHSSLLELVFSFYRKSQYKTHEFPRRSSFQRARMRKLFLALQNEVFYSSAKAFLNTRQGISHTNSNVANCFETTELRNWQESHSSQKDSFYFYSMSLHHISYFTS